MQLCCIGLFIVAEPIYWLDEALYYLWKKSTDHATKLAKELDR